MQEVGKGVKGGGQRVYTRGYSVAKISLYILVPGLVKKKKVFVVPVTLGCVWNRVFICSIVYLRICTFRFFIRDEIPSLFWWLIPSN